MFKLLLIFCFGGLGAATRYLLGGAIQERWMDGFFPTGTLVVNTVGCFLIGFMYPMLLARMVGREEWRLAIITGFLGGFTTFSSYAWETLSFANESQFGRAFTNLALSNTLGILAAWIGYRIAIACFGTI